MIVSKNKISLAIKRYLQLQIWIHVPPKQLAWLLWCKCESACLIGRIQFEKIIVFCQNLECSKTPKGFFLANVNTGFRVPSQLLLWLQSQGHFHPSLKGTILFERIFITSSLSFETSWLDTVKKLFPVLAWLETQIYNPAYIFNELSPLRCQRAASYL